MKILELLEIAIRMLDCGTGAGGFKEGNTCSKGGDGEGLSEKDISTQYYKNLKKVEDVADRVSDAINKLPADQKTSVSKKIKAQTARLGSAFRDGFKTININSDGGSDTKRVFKTWKSKAEFDNYNNKLNDAVNSLNDLLGSLSK